MTSSRRGIPSGLAIIGVWVVALAALLPAARRAPEVLEVNARIEGSESATVDRLLVDELASPLARSLILVVDGVPAPSNGPGREAFAKIEADLESLDEVGVAVSYLDAPDSLLLGAQGVGGIVVVGIRPEVEMEAAVPRIREALETTGGTLRDRHPDVQLLLTGEGALNYDLRNAGAAEARAGERRVLPVAAALLVAGFGTLAAALLPVLSGAVAIPLALGLAVYVSKIVPLSILLLNVVSMIGLGLGIDYALLMVHRWRERSSGDRGLGAATETVALSALAVGLGFAALLTIPLNELRSVAVGGLLAVVASALLATTLLPVLLRLLGDRLEWGRVIGRKQRSDPGTPGGWDRWARWVVRHPVVVLIVSVPPLVVLAAQTTRLRTGIPPGDWLPSQIESAMGLERLEGMGRGALVQTVRVVIELPPDAPALTSEGHAAVVDATRAAAGTPGVTSVRSLATVVPSGVPIEAALANLPEALRASLVSADGRFVQLEVLPQEGASPEALTRLVESLRAATAAGLTKHDDARMWLGGLPAFNADFEAAVAGRFASVAGLVVGATLLMLVVGFRSVLIPLKAVALNLLSVAGAFGALVLVFQDGHGAGLMGLESVPGSVFPMIPVLVFCVVFGLSMDYEVFLVSRVAEARVTMGERDAVAEGLARTGHVITSAAAIMIAVFGGFTLGDFVLVKMLGFTVAVAVLLDAAVVRVAIGPALLVLLGRWNWWPGDKRSVRQAHAKHEILEAPLAPERIVDRSHPEPGEIHRADSSRLLEQVHR